MGDRIEKLRILTAMLRQTFVDWREHVWSRDLDARYCCDGYECGCGGVTTRDVWSHAPTEDAER